MVNVDEEFVFFFLNKIYWKKQHLRYYLTVDTSWLEAYKNEIETPSRKKNKEFWIDDLVIN